MDALDISINMTTSSLKCTLSEASLEKLCSDEHVLAVIAHNSEKCCGDDSNIIETGMPQLGKQHNHEVWLTDASVETAEENSVKISQTSNIIMASCCMEESGDLSEDTRIAYENLLKTVKSRGYPHLLRAWNYIANINEGEGDSERYKQFCLGRHLAFDNTGVKKDDYPAASALGHSANNITIYLISARHPGRHIENPNQQSAYTYPKQYGPKSPSFARATVSPELEQTFISGTASITGHETLHINDVEKQLKLTLYNIQQLATHIEETQHVTLKCGLFKAYIRHAKDFEWIQSYLSSNYPGLSCLYLQADICRADLLLEIEAVYNHL